MYKDDYWILIDRTGKPVGLDQDSGGYPFISSHPSTTKYWTSKEDAVKYASKFKDAGYSPRMIGFRLYHEIR
jgi:hypothetical protein